ncbi:hypothetical protein BDQ17DRAFT_1439804 [Cyathus striatus]|nr:hypothetical protein BDQ17DRAFT_1439804 [Cyathus striatus]
MSRYTERRSSRASTTTVLPDYETSQRNRELPPIPVPQIPPLPPVPPLATYSAPPPAPLPRRGTSRDGEAAEGEDAAFRAFGARDTHRGF